MINKEKTIKKALSKYRAIFPIRGKSSIEECFVCMRGEYFLLFRTQDKKRHMLKAEDYRPTIFSSENNSAVLNSAFRFLNKPIYVRSLFFKNMKNMNPASVELQNARVHARAFVWNDENGVS